jgi:hypothetical protein
VPVIPPPDGSAFALIEQVALFTVTGSCSGPCRQPLAATSLRALGLAPGLAAAQRDQPGHRRLRRCHNAAAWSARSTTNEDVAFDWGRSSKVHRLQPFGHAPNRLRPLRSPRRRAAPSSSNRRQRTNAPAAPRLLPGREPVLAMLNLASRRPVTGETLAASRSPNKLSGCGPPCALRPCSPSRAAAARN